MVRLLVAMSTFVLFGIGFVGTASASCPTGQVNCGGQCVDLKTDEDNCGRCGTTCGRAQSCSAGACRLECPDVQLACGNVCVTATSDPMHCGGCGKACASNQYCSGGQCKQATCSEPKKVNTGGTKLPDSNSTSKTH